MLYLEFSNVKTWCDLILPGDILIIERPYMTIILLKLIHFMLLKYTIVYY